MTSKTATYETYTNKSIYSAATLEGTLMTKETTTSETYSNGDINLPTTTSSTRLLSGTECPLCNLTPGDAYLRL